MYHSDLNAKIKTPCKAADCQPTAVSADDSIMFAGSTWYSYLTQTFCSSPDAKGLAACSATWPLQVRPFQRGFWCGSADRRSESGSVRTGESCKNLMYVC